MFKKLLTTCVALLIFTGAVSVSNKPAISQPTGVRLLSLDAPSAMPFHITHGALFDANFQRLEVSPKQVMALQQVLLDKLRTKADPALVKRLASTERAGSDSAQVWRNAVEIGRLNASVKSSFQDTIRTDNFRLLSRYAAQFETPIDTQALLNGQVPIWARYGNISSITGKIDWGAIFFPPKGLLYTYADNCKANGVPLPPKFDTHKVLPANAPWHNMGPLNFSILNSDKDTFAEVYAYYPKDKSGMCIALPIRTKSTDTEYIALGVICQSVSTTKLKNGMPDTNKSNSKACFWDNGATMSTENVYDILDASSPNPYFISPDSPLPDDNRCSDCHAGENAYITHLGSTIETARADSRAPDFTARNNWYKPMLKSTWPQNPEVGTYAAPAGAGCAGCHYGAYAGRIPDVTGAVGGNPSRDHLFKYCDRIITGEIASGVGHHALSYTVVPAGPYPKGPMNGNVGGVNGTNLVALHKACGKLYRAGSNYPATPKDWLNW